MGLIHIESILKNRLVRLNIAYKNPVSASLAGAEMRPNTQCGWFARPGKQSLAGA
jgi:hypothetical protein